jgi:hypothetical protein
VAGDQTEQRVEAIRLVLRGLTEGMEVGELTSEVLLLHPRDRIFPGDVLIELAADALDVVVMGRSAHRAIAGYVRLDMGYFV